MDNVEEKNIEREVKKTKESPSRVKLAEKTFNAVKRFWKKKVLEIRINHIENQLENKEYNNSSSAKKYMIKKAIKHEKLKDKLELIINPDYENKISIEKRAIKLRNEMLSNLKSNTNGKYQVEIAANIFNRREDEEITIDKDQITPENLDESLKKFNSNNKNQIIQDLPINSKDEQTFKAQGMSEEEIKNAIDNFAKTNPRTEQPIDSKGEQTFKAQGMSEEEIEKVIVNVAKTNPRTEQPIDININMPKNDENKVDLSFYDQEGIKEMMESQMNVETKTVEPKKDITGEMEKMNNVFEEEQKFNVDDTTIRDKYINNLDKFLDEKNYADIHFESDSEIEKESQRAYNEYDNNIKTKALKKQNEEKETELRKQKEEEELNNAVNEELDSIIKNNNLNLNDEMKEQFRNTLVENYKIKKEKEKAAQEAEKIRIENEKKAQEKQQLEERKVETAMDILKHMREQILAEKESTEQLIEAEKEKGKKLEGEVKNTTLDLEKMLNSGTNVEIEKGNTK